MKRLLLTVAVLAGSLLAALPSAATASHDPSGAPLDQDFVGGSGARDSLCFLGHCFPLTLDFGARSGPGGENPTGTIRVAFTFEFRVTCLAVSGNRATIGTTGAGSGLGPRVVFVEDNDGVGEDLMAAALVPSPPTVCPAPETAGLAPLIQGDITVHDAPVLPIFKQQCKDSGWQSFGVFKNQGDCVSFVATEGKNQPSGPPRSEGGAQ